MISGESQYGGHSLAAGTSALMTLGMGQRLLKTGKFMPAGLVSVLAAASMGYHVKKALEWKGYSTVLLAFSSITVWIVFGAIAISAIINWCENHHRRSQTHELQRRS